MNFGSVLVMKAIFYMFSEKSASLVKDFTGAVKYFLLPLR